MNDLNRSQNLAVRPRAGCFLGVFLLPVLMAGLGLMLAGRVTAQTFTTLRTFTGGTDGRGPESGLILSGNTLYGTAEGGGILGHGTVFAINTDGTGFTNLYSFPAASIVLWNHPILDYFYPSPRAKLIVSGNTLYGTAIDGGTWGNGSVFAINTDGSGLTNLYNFTASTNLYSNSDGAIPFGGLTLSGNTLYGTALLAGSSGSGTVFKVNTDGTGFTNLYCFTAIVDRNADIGGGTNTVMS